MPEFSVIMQTKLMREGAEEKLIRAVNSVFGQKPVCDYELIIVADGCKRSYDLIAEGFSQEFGSKRLRLFLLSESKKNSNKWWSIGRNVGIEKASGTWIIYLDNDDYYVNNYLKRLTGLDTKNDWYLVDDYVYRRDWQRRRCNLQLGHCGTANIIHKRSMKSRWPQVASYGKEDWRFIQNLMIESKKYEHLDVVGYCCCHIPKQYEV